MKTYKGVPVTILPTVKLKPKQRHLVPTVPGSRLPTREFEYENETNRDPNAPTRDLIRAQWQLMFEELSRLELSNTSLKRKIQKLLIDLRIRRFDFSEQAFARAYLMLSQALDERFALQERRVSLHEMEFEKYLNHALTRKRRILSQFWMGRFNVDSWLPWARNQSTLTIIIEVCGGVYNDLIKQVKFGKKCDFIETELRIPIQTVNTSDASYQMAKTIVHDQLSKREIGSRTLKRLQRKIEITTLAAWINSVHEDIYTENFGLSFNDFCMVRNLILKNKETSRFEKFKDFNLLSPSTSKSESL